MAGEAAHGKLHAKSSVTGRVARRDMALRTIARLVSGIERCSILCDFDARQSRASKMSDKIAGVTSVLLIYLSVEYIIVSLIL